MFNSYSFLNCLTVEERKKFNSYKVEYAKNQQLKSYIDVNYDGNFGYFSFALACRNDSTYEFDVEKYISIWDDFINKYYSNRSHIEPKIQEQILRRVDHNHISNDFEKEFDTYSPGVYFILRLNRHKVSSKFKKFLCTEFGISEISVGPLKIVTANDMKRFNEVCRLGYIAAFKIVKQ